jgi:hypothetical protein
MNYTVKTGDKRIQQAQTDLGKKAWPEFMQHDSLVEKHWSKLYTEFPDFQLAGYSENELVGVGNSVPIHWEGEFNNLPDRGLDWAIEKAIDDTNIGLHPNILVGVQILIHPDMRSKGLSYEFLEFMKYTARTSEIEYLALPVRPTQKHLYPLVPMEEYILWTNDKGESFDPWIRVHIKAGGMIVSVCSESMTIQGKINEWEDWTGLCFQSSGLYTIEDALSPVYMDLEEDYGEYIEPNVWIIHAV